MSLPPFGRIRSAQQSTSAGSTCRSRGTAGTGADRQDRPRHRTGHRVIGCCPKATVTVPSAIVIAIDPLWTFEDVAHQGRQDRVLARTVQGEQHAGHGWQQAGDRIPLPANNIASDPNRSDTGPGSAARLSAAPASTSASPRACTETAVREASTARCRPRPRRSRRPTAAGRQPGDEKYFRWSRADCRPPASGHRSCLAIGPGCWAMPRCDAARSRGHGWYGGATPQPQCGTGAAGITSAPGCELCMASRVPHSR